METKDILKTLRKNKGYSTMQDFCVAAGISFSTYQNYETGKRIPTAEILIKLADYFCVTTDYLLGRQPAPDPFADFNLSEEDESKMLASYLSFPPVMRACIMDCMRKLADGIKGDSVDAVEKVVYTFQRLSVHKASAGVGYDLYDPDAWQSVDVVDCPEAHDADFAVTVEGDSMEPDLHDGDIVFVKIDPEVPEGEIGIFMVDGCGYIKERGHDRLISHNPAYGDIPLAGRDQRCVGRVIGVAELA